jgi:2-haloacid dehalogenase
VACTGKYDDFFNITRNSLLHTLAEFSVKLHDEDIDGLMEAYDHLSTFPDVIPALKGVSTNSNITAVVFSNGTKTMVSNSVFRSQDLSPHAKIFQHLVTVDEVKKFKPAPEVYHHLAQTTGKEMKDIWLVSANPFDIVGATTIGINAAWVDRAGRGWEDNAVPSVRPKVIGKGVEEIFKSIISQI